MSTKSHSANHWLWFVIIVSAYSVYDYLEHIIRDGQAFGEKPFAWGLFSLASVVTLLSVSFFTSKILRRIIPPLSSDVLGVAFATMIHLKLTGPLWDQLFWDGDLYFHKIWLPMVLFSVIYLIFRGVHYLITLAVARYT